MRLHGGDLDRLVSERVLGMQVAEDELQRRQHRGQRDRHAQHGARFFDMAARQQIARADRDPDKAAG